MAKPTTPDNAENKPASAIVAALLGWVLPGLGHWWIGERVRGVILFIVVTATFWGGVAVAGVRTTVTPRDNGLWIAAQLCAGPQAFLALFWSDRLRNNGDHQANKAMWPASTIGVVYAGVAGLLNLLVIIDVLAKAETAGASAGARAPPHERRQVR